MPASAASAKKTPVNAPLSNKPRFQLRSVSLPEGEAPGLLGRLTRLMRRGMEEDIRGVLSRMVRPGDRVLEITAGARSLAKELEGVQAETVYIEPTRQHLGASDVETLSKQVHKGPYDVIFLQGVISYTDDIQGLLEAIRPGCSPDTRVILLSYNALWQPILQVANRLGLRQRTPDENWLSSQDVHNLLLLADLDLISWRRRVLMPAGLPVVKTLFNKLLSAMPGGNWLGLCDWYVARPTGLSKPEGKVSVVVPARNEAGNIARILSEMPKMGTGVELLFVEGNSTDNTWDTIQREVAAYRGHAEVRVLKQKGKGKKDASFLGFEEATGDYLMIFDADITVPAADLPKFYEALKSGKGEFINGTRLVYPLNEGAMRFLNLLGNRFFATVFSTIIGQELKDTLCGTKVLTKRNWDRLNALRKAEFGERDPFGDFDLLFGASRLQLKIVEIPIRYQARTYGETNISRFSHGWMLLKMCGWGFQSLKFV